MASWTAAGALALVLLVASQVLAHGSHECIHDHLMTTIHERHGIDPRSIAKSSLSYLHDTVSDSTSRKLLAVTRGPIRFYIDYSHLENDNPSRTCFSPTGSVIIGNSGGPECQTASDTNCNVACTATNTLTAEKKAHIMNVLVPAATAYLSAALQSVQVAGSLSLTPGDCTVRDPVTINTPTVSNSDIMLIVTARPTVGTLIAFAGTCRTDVTNRPIGANINFGPTFVETGTTASALELGTAIHEMMHALGFTYANFAKYWDFDGNSQIPLAYIQGESLTMTGPGPAYSGALIPKLVNSSHVQTEARAHYGCPSLRGMPIENQGGAGTVNSHWEKRVGYNEIMTGTSSTNPVISRITLALFEDMGWYTADYSKAGSLLFGKNAGCGFVDAKCTSAAPAWAPYICSVDSAKSCNFDRSARGSCFLLDPTPTIIPPEMRYFGASSNLGGAETIADFCPLVIEFSTGWCNNPSFSDPVEDDAFAQIFSTASMCFDSNIGGDSAPDGHCYVAGCLSATTLASVVGPVTKQCTGGESIVVGGMTQSASCPSAAFIAQKCAPLAAGTFPTVTAIAPNAVAAGGGTAVTITGTGLDLVNYVSASGANCAAPFTAQSATSISCTLDGVAMPTALQSRVRLTGDVYAITSAGRAGVLANGVTVRGSSPAAATAPLLAAVVLLAGLLSAVLL